MKRKRFVSTVKISDYILRNISYTFLLVFELKLRRPLYDISLDKIRHLIAVSVIARKNSGFTPNAFFSQTWDDGSKIQGSTGG